MCIRDRPQLLVKAMELIEELPLEKGDTKGDLYEYLLGKLTTAGINGHDIVEALREIKRQVAEEGIN